MDTTEQEERFSLLQAQARREAEQRQKQRAAQTEERLDVVADGLAPAQACDQVDPQDRLSCPIRPRGVAKVSAIPDGVRLLLRRRGPSAEKLELAVANPRERPLCPFLDAQTDTRVRNDHGRVAVDLIRPGDADPLREQVRIFTAR
jgi:hypothetical protein